MTDIPAQSDLGGLLSVFRGRITPWNVVLMAFLGAIVGFTAAHYSGSPLVGWILAVMIALGGVAALWRRARKFRVEVYSEGLVYRDGTID